VVDLLKAPPGRHAIHVHQKADCGNKGENAGEHFSPEGHKHGLPGDPARHMGDMGNIDVLNDKTGRLEFVIEGANLKAGDPKSLVDRAIIIHDKEDKGTQPSGGAGGRIGCGKITR
jgi:Cu-Zn family superoxide dismutase